VQKTILNRSIDDNQGQVAVTFAIVALPILLMTLITIDFARQINTKQHLAFATDAASLAATRAMEDPELSDLDIEKTAQDYYLAQLESAYGDVECEVPVVTVNRPETKVTVAGNCNIPTFAGGLLTTNEATFVANTTAAAIELNVLEVALVLDLSDSMIGAKETAMKAATKDFVSGIVNLRADDQSRISLIPFASTLNAGVYGNRAMGRDDDDDRTNDGLERVCVVERPGVEALTDAAPGPGQWFEEHGSIIRPCESEPIVPLSNDESRINTAIEHLRAVNAGSSGQLALAWAWYTLSPNWSSIWPASAEPSEYNSSETVKAVILLSDGMFNKWYDRGALSTIYARVEAIRLCREMRRDGIQVFVIGYDVPVGLSFYSAETVMRECASSPDFYFEADIDDVGSVLDQISAILKSSWLVE